MIRIAEDARSRRVRVVMSAALAALLTAACAPEARASIYYVDYQAGSDAADGVSPEGAWKHAPGDPAATDRASTIKLQPGDTVRFRGGVGYHGTIILPAGGTKSAPIVYAGDQWGSASAVIDGGDQVESVVPCPSAEACGGAANWNRLSLISFDPPKTELIKFFDSTGNLFESQYPSPKDQFFSDDVSEYQEVPLSEAEAVRNGALRSAPLANAIASGPTKAQVSIWIQGNRVARKPIIGVAGDTIQFEPSGILPYTNRAGRAAVVNAVQQVDRPGVYATISAGKAVAWLREGAAGSHLTIGNGRLGVDLNGRSNVVVRGFVFEHFVAGKYGEGTPLLNSAGLSTNPIVEANIFRRSALYTGGGAVMIGNTDGAVIKGNTFADLERGSGIRTARPVVSNLQIVGNDFKRLGQTGILAMGVTNLTISKNTMSDLYGIHGNGISLYMDNRGALVSGNRIANSTRPMTFHGEDPAKARNPGDHEIVIEHNFFATPHKSAGAIISFGNTRGVTIRDNVLVAPKVGLLLSATDTRLVVTGNHTTSIQTKGAQPPDWVVKDNSKPTAAQLKEAGLAH